MASFAKYGRPIGWCVTAAAFALLFTALPEEEAVAATYFFLERPKLGIDLSYDYESEKRQGLYTRTRDASQAFREKLDLETEGWIYHPALVMHKIRLSPEWEQMREQADTGTERARQSFLSGYSAHVAVLPQKPYTLNLFASRHRSVLKSSFARTSETEGDAYGATLSLKYRPLPTLLSFVHSTSAQAGFYESRERRDDVRLHLRHEENSNDTKLNATHTERIRTTTGITLATKNSDGILQNLYRITPDNRVMLNSSLFCRRTESDFLDTSGMTLSETLNWRHAKNLSTNYTINVAEDSIGGSHSETTNLGAGLSHFLYENLQTTATANTSKSSFSGGRENVSGGNLGFDYRRSIPGGMLSVTVSHDYREVRRSLTEQYLDVVEESHILRIGEVTLLGNENVDMPSITVVDASRTIIYIRDVDYRVEALGAFVRISRTSFGAIADGQAVLASYRYLSNPSFDYSTLSRSYGAGLYLWSAWRINYWYNRSEQNFLGGVRPAILNEDTTHIVETDLTWRWTATKIIYEDSKRASGVSMTRWLATEYVTFRPRENFYFGLSGHCGQTKLKGRDELEDLYGLRSDVQWFVTRESRVKIEAFYDRISGSLNRTVDKGGASALEWFGGLWGGDLTYRFLSEKDLISGARLDRHSLLFRITRALF